MKLRLEIHWFHMILAHQSDHRHEDAVTNMISMEEFKFAERNNELVKRG